MELKHDANAGLAPSHYGLEHHGIRNINIAWWNLGTAQLLEHAIQRREGGFAANGSFVVRTGQFTGRSPKDKFVVRDEITDPTIQWGAVNQPISEAHFDRLYSRMMAFWQGHDVYVQDCFVGADPEYTLPMRVVSQLAWHNLFARQLFIRPNPARPADHKPEFTILFAPDFQANPAEDGTNSETCIVLNFKRRVVLICGTSYAGEMKKSAFTIMNYLLPARGVFPMHCSANVGEAGDAALFFGLSGTGKTTLSADPQRRLIGDDEHGWSDSGVFNFEGGCYAKCIRLSQRQEPQIWNAIRFGTVLENVAMDAETRLAGFQLRRGHREHARGVSAGFHRQRADSQRGGAPQERHLPDGRRLRRAAADLQADAGAGDVSLPQRLHGQGGGHRARLGEGAGGHLQRLLRRAVSAAAGVHLRLAAGRETAPAPRPMLAGEYRLGGRRVRRGQPHEAAATPAPC